MFQSTEKKLESKITSIEKSFSETLQKSIKELSSKIDGLSLHNNNLHMQKQASLHGELHLHSVIIANCICLESFACAVVHVIMCCANLVQKIHYLWSNKH